MTSLLSLPSNIDKKTFRKCALLFLVLSYIVYGKSIGNKYAMDDEYVIFNNAQVHRGIAAIPEIFRTTYSIESKSSFEYRPIVKVTYAIEYQIFGQNPFISHFINILIYFLTVLMLFYILIRLMPDYHYILPMITVLLFLVLPLHSEVVLSLKNRDVMLSFIFVMFSLLFYLRFAEGKGNWNILFGFIFMLIAIMSKKDCMTFFAVIPFTVWFFRNVSWKKIVSIIVSYLPVFFTFRFAVKSVVNSSVRVLNLWENPLFINHTTFFQRIPEGFYCVYFYLKMFIIPHPLLCYYGYNQVPVAGWDNPFVWFALILICATAYYIIKKRAFKEIWVYGIIYFLINISMFTNIVTPVVGIVGERFTFLASIGLCLSVSYALLKYFKIPLSKPDLKLRGINNNFWVLITLIILVYGGRSFARNAAWKDAYTLYKTDAANATESAHTHTLLAATAIAKAKADPRMSKKEKRELVLEAEEHYLESLRIIPDYISSHNNLGMLYYTYLNSPDKALVHLEKALELDPNYVEAYFNAATAYASLGQFDKAEKYYLKSIEINPDFVNTYLSLSNIYASQKRFDKIIKLNQPAIDRGVKSDIPYINMGNVYFLNGDTLKALPYLEKAIFYNPNNKGVNSFLSDYYRAKGDQQKSAYYRKLLLNSAH